MNKHFKNCFGSVPHLIHIAPTVVEFFQIRRLVLPHLIANKFIWHQGTLLSQGKRYGFKAFSRLTPEGRYEFFLQVNYDSIIQDALLERLLLQ
eukprot:snap_masked-scaffold_8-processed-gene-13.46-mRNA-1 protein AED:1.00 eAED:1.00 QI:0/0/0/0/1/1/2/0/92